MHCLLRTLSTSPGPQTVPMARLSLRSVWVRSPPPSTLACRVARLSQPGGGAHQAERTARRYDCGCSKGGSSSAPAVALSPCRPVAKAHTDGAALPSPIAQLAEQHGVLLTQPGHILPELATGVTQLVDPGIRRVIGHALRRRDGRRLGATGSEAPDLGAELGNLVEELSRDAGTAGHSVPYCWIRQRHPLRVSKNGQGLLGSLGRSMATERRSGATLSGLKGWATTPE